MKLIDEKMVSYFGIMLVVDRSTKYLVTTESGNVIASVQKPELDPDVGWLYDWDSHCVCIASVDLEGMDWKDTLMEIE